MGRQESFFDVYWTNYSFDSYAKIDKQTYPLVSNFSFNRTISNFSFLRITLLANSQQMDVDFRGISPSAGGEEAGIFSAK